MSRIITVVLCFVGSVVFGQQVRVYNNAATTKTCNQQYESSPGVWTTILGQNTLSPGAYGDWSTLTVNENGKQVRIRATESGQPTIYTDPQTYVHGGSMLVFYIGGSPPSSYYVSGCITNNGSYAKQFFYNDSLGITEPSGYLPPGGVWCMSRTNTEPFTYWFTWVDYNSDGGTNQAGNSNTYPGYTNAPGTGTGSYNYGGEVPNNPVGPSSGAGSGTNLTGGQFAAGVSNLYNVTREGNAMVVAGLANVARAFSNMNAGVTNKDYTGQLNAISNNTAVATNYLAELSGVLGSNSLANFEGSWGVSNAGSAVWNRVNAIGSNINKGFSESFETNSRGIRGATNIAVTVHEPGLWTFQLGNAAWRSRATNHSISLDPSTGGGAGLWNNLKGWMRMLWSFVFAIGGIYYVKSRIEDEIVRLTMVPGSAPWKSYGSALFSGLSLAFVTTVLASAPIVMAVVYDSMFPIGFQLVFPWSTAGISTAGEYSPTLLESMWLLNEFFPMAFVVGLGVYLIFFDITIVGWILTGRLAMRWITT